MSTCILAKSCLLCYDWLVDDLLELSHPMKRMKQSALANPNKGGGVCLNTGGKTYKVLGRVLERYLARAMRAEF